MMRYCPCVILMHRMTLNLCQFSTSLWVGVESRDLDESMDGDDAEVNEEVVYESSRNRKKGHMTLRTYSNTFLSFFQGLTLFTVVEKASQRRRD